MRFRTGALLTFLALLPAAPTVSAQTDDDSDAQELVERYVPIVMLRTQEEPCDSDGEPFVPMNVDLLLDNPQIALRQVGNGDPTVMRAPGAADLFDLGEGFYLDAPGDSLNPGCLYEQDHDRFNAGQPAVVYAHIAQQPDEPDQLAVQYWLYWYYNDWNNVHEGDWEFVQLMFPASSVAEALATEPESAGYAQHEGGERADWDGDKLQREGTHPVVYSSQRSHASYYNAALYMGRSGSEGFGCDNTDEPSTRVEPEVVLLPDGVDDAADPLAWVDFDGRWGERHASPNNGPTGPSTKPQWTEPVTWQEGLRDSSFVVPSGDSQGAQLINTFCDVVEWGSVQFIRFVASPARMLFVLAVLTALAVFLLRRTSWREVESLPLPRQATGRRDRPCRRRALPPAPRHVRRRRNGRHSDRRAGAVDRSRGQTTSADRRSDRGLRHRGHGRTLRHRLDHQPRVRPLGLRRDHGGGGVDRRRPGRRPPDARRALRAVAARAGRARLGVPDRGHRHRRPQLLPPRHPDRHLAVRALDVHRTGGDARGPRRTPGAAPQRELVRKRWWHTAVVTLAVAAMINLVGLIIGLLVLVVFTSLPIWALSVVVRPLQPAGDAVRCARHDVPLRRRHRFGHRRAGG